MRHPFDLANLVGGNHRLPRDALRADRVNEGDRQTLFDQVIVERRAPCAMRPETSTRGVHELPRGSSSRTSCIEPRVVHQVEGQVVRLLLVFSVRNLARGALDHDAAVERRQLRHLVRSR